MRVPRRAVCAGLAAALAGCVDAAPSRGGTDPTDDPSSEPTTAESPDGQSTTERPTTADPPAYASCDGAATVGTESLPAIPESLTEARVATYVERVERAVVLPPASERTDGYVQIASVSTEAVLHGFLARVEVTGGYYNQPREGNTTATVHADLGTHVGNYFVNERVVRRIRDDTGASDPRDAGEVLVCEAE